MIINMFDIQGGKVVLTHNCLSIPELKAIVDKYPDPIPALNFLHFRYEPTSPYANIAEDEKDDVLLHDFPGDYTLEDPEMLAAIEKLEVLHITPTYRYYLDNKALIEKMGAFARNAVISAGRDGNASVLQGQLKSVGRTITEFKQLEKIVLQELSEGKGRTRGDKKLAYDQK